MPKLRREIKSEDEYSIVDFGWDDRIEGKKHDDNPYAINNPKHYDWDRGWLMADEAETPTSH